MRISDWSSDVCSSDLQFVNPKTFERNRESYNIVVHSIRSLMSKYEGTFYTLHDYSIVLFVRLSERFFDQTFEKLVLEIDDILTRNNVAIGLTPEELGRESCRERVCQYV